ncbi:MAG: extracellular solute-binding protein [bacterium]
MLKQIVVLSIVFVCLCGAAYGETVQWWQFWTDPAVRPTLDSLVAEFEKANPDIDVKLTDLTWANGHEKIVIALSSGTGPDILELGSDWIAQFAAEGHLQPIGQESLADSSEYIGWSLATYMDTVFARPWILGTRVVFFNRELLLRAGYDTTFVPVTWDQLKEAAYRIDSLGADIYGWGSNTAEKHRLYKKFLPFFWSYGAQIFSDDGRYCVLSSTAAIDALRFYKELHDSCGYVGTQRNIEDAFLAGKVGIILSGDWLLKRIENEQRDIDLVTGLFPGRNYPGRSFYGGEYLAINAASQKAAAANKFIEFLTSPANQVRFCKANRSANPSSKTAQTDPYFVGNVHLQTFIKQIALANHPPVVPEWVSIEAAIEEAVEDALYGSGLVAEPLRIARGKIAALRQ